MIEAEVLPAAANAAESAATETASHGAAGTTLTNSTPANAAGSAKGGVVANHAATSGGATASHAATGTGAAKGSAAGKSMFASLGPAKATTMAFVAAHPAGVVVAGGVLFTIGFYYLGKFVGGRRARRKLKESAA